MWHLSYYLAWLRCPCDMFLIFNYLSMHSTNQIEKVMWLCNFKFWLYSFWCSYLAHLSCPCIMLVICNLSMYSTDQLENVGWLWNLIFWLFSPWCFTCLEQGVKFARSVMQISREQLYWIYSNFKSFMFVVAFNSLLVLHKRMYLTFLKLKIYFMTSYLLLSFLLQVTSPIFQFLCTSALLACWRPKHLYF